MEFLKNLDANNPVLKYLIIPVLTAIFTVLFTSFKENRFESKKKERDLIKEQLIELYYKLFVLYLQYYDLLKIIEETEVDIDEDGCKFSIDNFGLENPELWKKAEEEVEKLIYDKIHLLSYHDLQLWHQYLQSHIKLSKRIEKEDIIHESEFYDSNRIFKEFLLSTTKTYGNLYNTYHGRKISHWDKLKNIQKNFAKSWKKILRAIKTLKRKRKNKKHYQKTRELFENLPKKNIVK